MYLNIIKAVYDKPIAHILNSEKLKDFSVRSGTKQESPLLQFVLTIVLEVLATDMRQSINSLQIIKEEVKLFSCT